MDYINDEIFEIDTDENNTNENMVEQICRDIINELKDEARNRQYAVLIDSGTRLFGDDFPTKHRKLINKLLPSPLTERVLKMVREKYNL